MRVGVNTGGVVVTSQPGGARVTGDAVNTAARLQAAAPRGEALLGLTVTGGRDRAARSKRLVPGP